ncbi:MAG TPA: type II toxin-antitoxin system VapC family toxin [Thermodesulfovibrionales bacterium]|nr:type II toxin-antitoxin system VapC family toxin [Thermodesulfovibrionales bacterium]
MKRRRLLDSFALLVYLKGERGHEKVKALIADRDGELLMNDINLGETYYILARERGKEEADYFVEVVFPSLPIAHVPNSLADVLAAARIKSRHAVSYADCFAAATALRENASIVTGDPEFRKLEKEVKIEWL